MVSMGIVVHLFSNSITTYIDYNIDMNVKNVKFREISSSLAIYQKNVITY